MLTHWKRLWCREGSGAGGKGDDSGWDGCMASLTRWMWVCVNSGSWWWTGSPGMLWFMGSQRVGHDWATELNWMWFSLNYCTLQLCLILLYIRLCLTVKKLPLSCHSLHLFFPQILGSYLWLCLKRFSVSTFLSCPSCVLSCSIVLNIVFSGCILPKFLFIYLFIIGG